MAHIALESGTVASERRGADAADALFATLAARAAANDLDAFDELMALTERRVVSVAWRMLGNAEDARDAAQEVFLRVFRSIRTYRSDQPFMPWIFRITVNVCCDAGRRRRREGNHAPVHTAEEELPPVVDDVDARILLEERRRLVARALELLPERERAAFVLRDVEGLSTDEVARALGTRAATVRSQVSLARSKIRAYCAKVLEE